MKPAVLLALSLLALGTAAAQPITVPTLGPRFRQTRERAEILFGRRDGNYPSPDSRWNLFHTPDLTPATPAGNIPEADPVAPDEVLMNEAAVALKGKGGFVTRNGRAYFTVGQKYYAEGDSISVPLKAGPVELRVTRISGNSVTLTLNQIETVMRF